MRIFILDRIEDESGVSGTGVVAEGVQFVGGKCVICWLVKPHSIGIYNSLAEVEQVHDHGGKTKIKMVTNDA